MIQTLKMRKAYEYLDRAIYWNQKMVDTESTIRFSTKVEMLMNYACRLELEALGFIYYGHRFNGPYLGAISCALPGPVYPENSTAFRPQRSCPSGVHSTPVPYNHPSRRLHISEPMFSKLPTLQEQSWALH